MYENDLTDDFYLYVVPCLLLLTSSFVFSIDFVKIVRFLWSVRWYYAQFFSVLVIVVSFYSLTVMQSGQG
jgi:hypothetical protein